MSRNEDEEDIVILDPEGQQRPGELSGLTGPADADSCLYLFALGAKLSGLSLRLEGVQNADPGRMDDILCIRPAAEKKPMGKRACNYSFGRGVAHPSIGTVVATGLPEA